MTMQAIQVVFRVGLGFAVTLWMFALLWGAPQGVADSKSTPANEELSGQIAGPEGVFIDAVSFYYKLDAEARFLNHRAEWESKTHQVPDLENLEELAWRAYNESSVEKPFDIWREMGGPDPLVFQPKIHLRNNTNTAWLDLKIRVIWRARIGELLADPELLLTDYEHLSTSAQWENLYVEELTVDVLSPGDEKEIPASPFQLFPFLAQHKNHWPEYLEIETQLLNAPGQAKPKAFRQALQMIPDHFVIPVHDKRRLTQ